MRSYRVMVQKAQEDVSYWVEEAKLDFSVDLNRLLQQKGLTNTELANRLGTSKAYITKLFRGDANATIETMVKAACAVGGRVHIHIADETASRVRWLDLFKASKEPRVEPAVAYWQHQKKVIPVKTGQIDETTLSSQA